MFSHSGDPFDALDFLNSIDGTTVIVDQDPGAVERAMRLWDEYLGISGEMPARKESVATHNTSWMFDVASHESLVSVWKGSWIIELMNIYDRVLVEKALRVTMENPHSLWQIEKRAHSWQGGSAFHQRPLYSLMAYGIEPRADRKGSVVKYQPP